MKHSIEFNGNTIQFNLIRKNVKNVNLNIRPDMSIVVSANDEVPEEFIINFVKNKASWILKTLKKFEAVQPNAYWDLEYVNGESIKYLGKQYRLKIFESNQEYVKYLKGFVQIYVKDKMNIKRKKSLLDKWLRQRAKVVFSEVFERMFLKVEGYGVKRPNVEIRIMKARWGSCLVDKGVIILNSELIKAPKFTIEYVILHELIHFIHRNHDIRFYRMMTILMPDWHDRKKILDEEVVREL